MKNNILNNFIVLEGLDGAGTSTQCRLLNQNIKSSILTFEPTDSPIGSLIRKGLQKKIILNQDTLSYLFAADRSDHIYGINGIINKIKDHIVICDRYLFSSLAYQSLDLPFKKVYQLNKYFPMPQVVFFLNTSTDVCQKRISKRGNNEEIFEKKELQQKILNNYLKAFDYYKDKGLNLIMIDGNLKAENILLEEIKYLKKIGVI